MQKLINDIKEFVDKHLTVVDRIIEKSSGTIYTIFEISGCYNRISFKIGYKILSKWITLDELTEKYNQLEDE